MDSFTQAQTLIKKASRSQRFIHLACAIIPMFFVCILFEPSMVSDLNMTGTRPALVLALAIYAMLLVIPALIGLPRTTVTRAGITYADIWGSRTVAWHSLAPFQVSSGNYLQHSAAIAVITGEEVHNSFMYRIANPRVFKVPMGESQKTIKGTLNATACADALNACQDEAMRNGARSSQSDTYTLHPKFRGAQ